ncbi:zinc metalloproteinase nas-10-like isoform X2 [Hydractinia symbiolongicarpus]|uniref:zinc metalloproteinase nas-10-like isoform X2 n=1 Tax=Hydractinia symbiolongicarpus TaxID=13093 RepID=UPI00254E8FE7|nr:zinc metalloproteinase nas-10-like isoform X2 [Hydractinia symbiolongicarpus]
MKWLVFLATLLATVDISYQYVNIDRDKYSGDGTICNGNEQEDLRKKENNANEYKSYFNFENEKEDAEIFRSDEAPQAIIEKDSPEAPEDEERFDENDISVNEEPFELRNRDHISHGDILFEKGEEEAVLGRKKSSDRKSDEQARDGRRDLNKRWPMPVPYHIEGSLGSSARSAISQAMTEIQLKTCIRFRQKQYGDTDYISFFKHPNGSCTL